MQEIEVGMVVGVSVVETGLVLGGAVAGTSVGESMEETEGVMVGTAVGAGVTHVPASQLPLRQSENV